MKIYKKSNKHALSATVVPIAKQQTVTMEIRKYQSGNISEGLVEGWQPAFVYISNGPILRTRDDLDQYIDGLKEAWKIANEFDESKNE